MEGHEYASWSNSTENDFAEEIDDVLSDNETLQENDGSMVDALLIDAVRMYPHLYDKSSRDFKDVLMKANSWKEISSVVNMTVGECQNRWTRLREKFSREKRLQELEERSGSGVSYRRKFIFMQNMQFLNKFVRTRRPYTNVKIVPKIRNSDNANSVQMNKETVTVSCLENTNNKQIETVSITTPQKFSVGSDIFPSGKLQGNVFNRNVQSSCETSDCNVADTELNIMEESADRKTDIFKNYDRSTLRYGKRKRPVTSNENQDPFAKSLLQMSTNICNQLEQQKDSADLAFGNFVGLELQKLSEETTKTEKKKKIMDILWS